MDEATRQSLIQKLEAIDYEWTTLIPRLTSAFRANAEICRQYTRDVLKVLRAMEPER